MTDVSASIVRDRGSPGGGYGDGFAAVASAHDSLQQIPDHVAFACETPDQNAEHATHCINFGAPLHARRSSVGTAVG
jgi:hypothetical protein